MVSWHRSQLDEFDLWSDGSIDWTPSELATEERRCMASDSNDEPPGDSGPVTGSRWCCMTCRAASWIWDNEVGYVCQNCGGLEFFDVSQPTKMETSTGVWMYVPHSPSSAVGSPDEDSKRCQGSLSDSPGRSPKDVRNDQRLFGDPEQDEEGDDDTPALDPEALAEMAHVLTVTSKKLQASVLGRKFTGRRSIEERKKNSTCSACGQLGHWAGDSICSVSSQKRDGGGKGARGSGTSSSNNFNSGHKGVKKAYGAYVVGIQEDQQQHDEQDHLAPEKASTYFSFTAMQAFGTETSTSWVAETIDLGGYMVLDTACQRSCCGEIWLNTHSNILHRHGLCVKKFDCVDHFQFGSGKPVAAAERAYIPAQFQGQESQGVLLGASILKSNIPFLASRTLLSRLGCVIDMFSGTITFTNLGVVLPLTIKHGHLAVSIVKFSDDAAQHACWAQLSKPHLWHDPDPELVCAPGALNKGSIRDLPPQQLLRPDVSAPNMSHMAEALGADLHPPADCGAQDVPYDGELGAHGTCHTSVAEPSRACGRDGAPEEAAGAGKSHVQSGNLHAPRLQEVRQHLGRCSNGIHSKKVGDPMAIRGRELLRTCHCPHLPTS